nr:MAG TPA: hypothetical protein [Caudoviricetes sp.]
MYIYRIYIQSELYVTVSAKCSPIEKKEVARIKEIRVH